MSAAFPLMPQAMHRPGRGSGWPNATRQRRSMDSSQCWRRGVRRAAESFSWH